MIKRIVKMSFDPSKIDEFKTVYRNNWEHIRGFKGCAHVELLQDRSDPSLFFTYSLWEDEQRLESYRRSELFQRVWSSTKALFNDKPQAWTVHEVNL